MKRYEIVVAVIAVIVMLFLCVVALRAEDKKLEPGVTTVTSLTADQKLTIRTAQVDMLVAANNLVNSNEWKQSEAARIKLNQTLTKIFTDLKLKQDDWDFDANLNLVKKPAVKK